MTALALGRFAEEGAWLRARTRAIAQDYRIVGEWAPYPPESLGQGTGSGGIVAVAAATGVLGALALFALESWSIALAYPFDSGGRALMSWQAFLIPAVEFSALAGAIGGFAMLFRNAGLTRLHHPAFAWPEVEHASQDSFVLALACDSGESANAALALLSEAGAAHSRLVAP